MQNDAVLIEQTLAGDEHKAFHRLIILYQADINALVMSYVKNPDDAKELVQEIFFEAYRNIGFLRNPERFYFWLRQIAKYRCQNWRERKNQDRFVPLSENIIAETPSADESLILRETLAKVMQAINELPETEKNILQERYLDDLSYTELQAKHGLSYKALSMRLLRAKQKVRLRVEKLLAGFGVYSWHDALEKMLLGGVEAVKIVIKTKLIITIMAVILIIVGSGIWMRHFHQYSDDTSKSSMSQETSKLSLAAIKQASDVKATSDKAADTIIEKQKQNDISATDANIHSQKMQELQKDTQTGVVDELAKKYPLAARFVNMTELPEYYDEMMSIHAERLRGIEEFTEKLRPLRNEESKLENALTTSTDENGKNDIKIGLEKVRNEIRVVKIGEWERNGEEAFAEERFFAKYFSTDKEFREALQQLRDSGMKERKLPSTPSSYATLFAEHDRLSQKGYTYEQEIEIIKESERRLKARGVVSPWVIVSW